MNRFHTFYIHTFGCKVNQADSSEIHTLLLKNGFMEASFSEADVIIVNSCTVTSSGDQKAVRMIAKIKQSRPETLVVLCGCMPQAYPKLAEQTAADIILGTRNKKDLPNYIRSFHPNSHRVRTEDYTKNSEFENLPYEIPESHTRAFLKVQDGCNRRCSYCAIPFGRGPSRSISQKDFQEKLELLVKNHCKEVVLTGINLGFFGKNEDRSLSDLVLQCNQKGLRVRFGSLEPDCISVEMLQNCKKCEGFCPQFHLSLQSGSDSVLKRMCRPHNKEEFAQLCKVIREIFPSASITTDLMIGFPGETDEEFEESLQFCETIGFSAMHIFPYSIREGTKAAEMPQVSDVIKQQRTIRAKELAKKLSLQFCRKQIGKTYPILFERQRDPNYEQGHAPNGLLVKVPKNPQAAPFRNSVFYVTIEEGMTDYCIGHLEIPENSK